MSNEIIKTDVLNGPASLEAYADNLKDKLAVCTLMLKSGLLPAAYKSPESVLTAILYGRELGFSPMRAINGINIIQGKPTLSADAMKALILSRGGKIKTIEWTDKLCTLEFVRGDWIEKVAYTIQDAALAGLTGKDNWRKMPKAMLYARCVSIGCRNQWADVLGGFYSTEEMRDSTSSQPVEPEPTRPDIDLTIADVLPQEIENEPKVKGKKVDHEVRYRLTFKDPEINFYEWKNRLKKNGFDYNPEHKYWYGKVEYPELASCLVMDGPPKAKQPAPDHDDDIPEAFYEGEGA